MSKAVDHQGFVSGEGPPVVLTIAGFDPSSGAGVTADLQVFAAHGLFGTAAITAITVQSTAGVRRVQAVDAQLLAETLDELQRDLPVAGIKIGMLGSAVAIESVASFLTELGAARPVVVLDPVLRASSGAALLEADALGALKGRLLPLVDWLTPNWAELAAVSGRRVQSEADAGAALDKLAGEHPGLRVVATGGDQAEPVDLLRLRDGEVVRLVGERVETTSTHGTGCAFSSALLSRLVRRDGATDAVRAAKRYIEGALRHAPGVGNGRGPMGLLWPLLRDGQGTGERG